MKTTLTGYLNFFGVRIQGDIGTITCYRSSRRGLVWFPKAPPTCPPSDLQADQRDKWKDIIEDWTELTDAARAAWSLIVERASLSLTGFNLYIWWRCSQDDAIINTLERQTGITVI
jgi:hypothetical protein